MKLYNIKTNRLLPNFCKNDEFVVSLCGTLDYIIQSISDRMDALPLNAGGYNALQMCRDDELVELASECINAPYYPDLDRESREAMLYAQDWWTWRTGVREVFEFALGYVFDTNSVTIQELDGKYKHHYTVEVTNTNSTELGFKRMTNTIREVCHTTATPDYIVLGLTAKIEQGTCINGLVSYKLEGSINA